MITTDTITLDIPTGVTQHGQMITFVLETIEHVEVWNADLKARGIETNLSVDPPDRTSPEGRLVCNYRVGDAYVTVFASGRTMMAGL